MVNLCMLPSPAAAAAAAAGAGAATVVVAPVRLSAGTGAKGKGPLPAEGDAGQQPLLVWSQGRSYIQRLLPSGLLQQLPDLLWALVLVWHG